MLKTLTMAKNQLDTIPQVKPYMCQKALPITNLLDSMYHCIRQPELLQDMGKLTKLENLNLSFNLIQSIPMSLQQLKNLK